MAINFYSFRKLFSRNKKIIYLLEIILKKRYLHGKKRMKKLVLFDKMYNFATEKQKKDIITRYKKYLNEKVKGFPKTTVEISKLRKFDNRFEVIIQGRNEVFLQNLIKKEFGTVTDFKDVGIGQEYKGNMIEVGKVGFGIFIDCAILNPRADVLLSLHTLREQLANGKNLSLKEIINAYDFIDKFPMYVKITEIDTEKNKLQGIITEKTLTLFKKIRDENIEAVFASGATKNQFKKAIMQKGHFRDIISVKRYGFLENLVLLKENTNAPGIISEIGKSLKYCKLNAIRPERIKKFW